MDLLVPILDEETRKNDILAQIEFYILLANMQSSCQFNFGIMTGSVSPVPLKSQSTPTTLHATDNITRMTFLYCSTLVTTTGLIIHSKAFTKNGNEFL